MTLDEAVKVLEKWDRQPSEKWNSKWEVFAMSSSVVVRIGFGDTRRVFARKTHRTAILSAARWAKKRMEAKQ